MKPIIEVNNLYKKYRIGEKQGYYSIRDTLVNLAKLPFGQKGKLKKEEFWALKDVSFKVMPGEVVGIIGRNGAGKSTLLKILSRITPPTKGKITLRGRVASLLEVGTGFSPELTGRENVYLNGAILGMKRSEIKEKFNEIVEFAEISKFLDTPVKFYSSGMYMRLAFAIAAHLEPEILLVDEVLAVGDVEFQKKCLGKMKEVSKQGRTVVFVSHNMAAIAQLCTKGALLESGRIVFDKVNKVIDKYLTKDINQYYTTHKTKEVFIKEIKTINEKGRLSSSFDFFDSINLKISVQSELPLKNMTLGVAILDRWGRKIFTSLRSLKDINKTETDVLISIPPQVLLSGKYSFDVAIFIPNYKVFDYVENQCPVDIGDTKSELAIYNNSDIGVVNVNCAWKFD